MKRRQFIKSTAALTAATAIPVHSLYAQSSLADRKFKLALNPGIIGVKTNLEGALDYAIKYGYEAISPYTKEVMKSYSGDQLSEHTAKMKEHGISYDSTNVPVDFRKGKNEFNEGFKDLRKHCETMAKQGATRINTWIISSHNELTYNENMQQHAYRLGECARVMKDYGIRFGLEYLGMRTMMNGGRYPFIGSMKEGKELIGEIGESNVGFILDSFHWYCANDTLADIKTLKPEDIITVDLNDAREGFTRIEQRDGKRELPATTGVIDIKTFLEGIIAIGYEGPVRTEPFNKVLNDMENDEALAVNMEAIKRSLALVGM